MTSWEVLPVRREVLHQPYLVKTLPPGPQRYQAGEPARDWSGERCQSGVQGVAAMRERTVTLSVLVRRQISLTDLDVQFNEVETTAVVVVCSQFIVVLPEGF